MKIKKIFQFTLHKSLFCRKNETREEAGARAKMLSISRNTYTEPNPARTAKRHERRSQLVSVLEKFGLVPLEEYMNMVAAHYND